MIMWRFSITSSLEAFLHYPLSQTGNIFLQFSQRIRSRRKEEEVRRSLLFSFPFSHLGFYLPFSLLTCFLLPPTFGPPTSHLLILAPTQYCSPLSGVTELVNLRKTIPRLNKCHLSFDFSHFKPKEVRGDEGKREVKPMGAQWYRGRKSVDKRGKNSMDDSFWLDISHGRRRTMDISSTLFLFVSPSNILVSFLSLLSTFILLLDKSVLFRCIKCVSF